MIKDIKFEGRGCAISQASASMLTELVMDKPLSVVKDLAKNEILENIGLVNLGPARIKCALLSLKVLKLSMVKYYADRDPESAKNLKILQTILRTSCKFTADMQRHFLFSIKSQIGTYYLSSCPMKKTENKNNYLS